MIVLAKGVLKWFLYFMSACLLFIGLIFIISTANFPWDNIEGAVFIGIAIMIIYFSLGRKPVEIKQTLDLSGAATVKEIKCPNCGGILNPDKVQVIDGKPFMTCDYCGNKFEITEEPKW